MVHFWLRAEQRANEQRTPLPPENAAKLIKAGHKVTVEHCPQRCWKLADYSAVGCAEAEQDSWEKEGVAPADAFIVGLKELSGDGTLTHRHCHFAHLFKGQPNWKTEIQRFVKGGGTLYDLEFLCHEGRRISSFGNAAGQVGCAYGLLSWAQQQIDSTLPLQQLPQQSWPTGKDLSVYVVEQLEKAAAKKEGKKPNVMIIGALGRTGRGATTMCKLCGIPEDNLTLWDLEETAKGGPFPEILKADILVLCILLDPKNPPKPFLTAEMLNSAERKLSVIADVTCESSNPNYPIPIPSAATDFDRPAIRMKESPMLDLVAIDHYPSLIPQESSTDFSNGLLDALLDFEKDEKGIWKGAEEVFQKKCSEAQT